MTPRAPGQTPAVHKIRTPGHGLPHQHHFAGGLLHKAMRGNDLNLTCRHRFRGHNPVDTTKMINMAVGKDHRPHWPLGQVLMSKGKSRGGCLLAGERINENPPRLPLDQGHIGKIKAT